MYGKSIPYCMFVRPFTLQGQQVSGQVRQGTAGSGSGSRVQRTWGQLSVGSSRKHMQYHPQPKHDNHLALYRIQVEEEEVKVTL
jgi:hypothetical protein